MRTRSTLVLALLPTLVLGYVLGSAGPGLADASPVQLEAPHGVYLTHDEHGSTLFVWSMKDGRPVGATSYECHYEWVTADGKPPAKVTELVTTNFGPKPPR